MTSILRITDGTNAVDLLSTTFGFHLNSWQQTVVLDKGGGVFQDSPLAEGRQLVYRQLANAVETYNMKLKQISQDIIARDIQDLMQLLEQAKRYWLKPSDRTPVWIEAKSTDETNTRYALIVNYQIPQLSNPYAQPFLQPDCLALLDDFDLIIERQHWLSNEPGSDTAIQTSNLQTVYRYGVFEPGTATDTADAGDDATFNTTDPLDLGDVSNEAHDVGIRFQSCTIPQGATITDARLELIVSGSALDVYTIVYGEDTDDAATFSTYADFTGRTKTTASVNWIVQSSVSSVTLPSPSLRDIIQEIVDRPGFSSGNDIVLFVDTDRTVKAGSTSVKAYDAGSPFNQLIVTWTESTVFGRAATTTNEVYIANKFNLAQLTHVYSYDNSTTSFSSNRLNATPPYNIYPDVGIAQSDIVYFGVSDDSDNAIEGGFHSIVFDLIPFEPNTVTDFIWEYWSGATWTSISADDFRDNTGSVGGSGSAFINSGVRSVHIQPPSNWAKTTINSVSAYWVRCRQSQPITVTQEAEQQNRQIYTITQPYADIASGQILGDIRSIARGKFENQSGLQSGSGAFTKRLILGVKSLSNGSDYVGYLNASDFQNGKGIYFTVGDDTTEGDTYIASANGERSTFTATDTVQATRGTWEIGSDVIASWTGDYHAYFRGYFQTQAGSGFPKVNIQVITGSEGVSFTGKQKAFITTADWELVDLGRINIPASALFTASEQADIVQLNLQIQADTIGDVVYLYDLILIPTEIWAGDIQTSNSNFGVSLQEYLEVDSVGLPKTNIRALVKRVPDDKIVSIWTPITNSKFGLLAEENLRLVALSAVTSGNGWISEPWVAHSIQLFNTNRYFGLRGGN